MTPVHKGLAFGLVIGLLGITLSITPFGWGLEETYGLAWLFHLRGERTPPPEVVIVAIDERSAIELELPVEPKAWPRHWHARLIDQLSTAGAKVIAFDLFFRDPKSPEEDQALAQAILKAGNVALVGELLRHEFSVDGSQEGDAIEKLTRPFPLLADAAMGVAPFPLAKIRERVNGYWTIKKTSFGEVPTLPLLTFQGYVRRLHPSNFNSLRHLNGGEDALYLDFYGPPRRIQTISYHEALQPENARLFEGKIVCVGLSESIQIKKKGDTFNTVFSQPNGLELSGVEILATAIANLVEDRPVRPLGPMASLGVVGLWGLLLGLVCGIMPLRIATGISLAIMLAYFWLAHHAFKTESLWMPLVVPMAFQWPLTLFAALAGKYRWLRTVFGYFLPSPRPEDVLKGPRLVYGTCLATDIERYTTVTEGMDPDQAGRMINAYHATVFPLVYGAGGFISDVLGDAVLAIWHGSSPDRKISAAACEAILDVAEALERFNQARQYPPLRTRFGVHTGEFLLGIVGARPHLEYRATGDVINTASRIEGLNKVLGTQILVSGETAEGLDEHILTRYVGQFLLAGKTTPIKIHELLGQRGEITADKEWLCKAFAEALEAYQKRDWDRANQLLLEILAVFPEDGPARYYRGRLVSDRAKSMGDPWDGVIRLETK
jgi:adenylate cyclase